MGVAMFMGVNIVSVIISSSAVLYIYQDLLPDTYYLVEDSPKSYFLLFCRFLFRSGQNVNARPKQTSLVEEPFEWSVRNASNDSTPGDGDRSKCDRDAPFASTHLGNMERGTSDEHNDNLDGDLYESS